jgi:hypothetical protein
MSAVSAMFPGSSRLCACDAPLILFRSWTGGMLCDLCLDVAFPSPAHMQGAFRLGRAIC